MVLGPNDAITVVVAPKNEGRVKAGQVPKDEKTNRRQRFQLKPYHILLVIYGIMAAGGIVFRMSN